MARWIGLNGDARSIILVGDVNLRNVTDPNAPFAHVQETFDAADLLFGNCEGCFSDPAVEIPYKQGWFHPNRETVEGLAAAGFDAVGCANNVHYGTEAILESLSHLDRHGIAHTGAGENREAARQPVVLTKRGTRFGFLAYTSVFWPVGHAAGPAQPGVATIKGHTAYRPHHRVLEMPGAPAIVVSWPDEDELKKMQEDVVALRERVDILVVSCHWGVSGSQKLVAYQTAIGHAAIDAGADLVIGHHPHVPQGMEIYNGRAIFYSLGNFFFGWERMAAFQRDGLLVHCAVREKALTKVSFAPVWRNEVGQPRIVSLESAEGQQIVHTVGGLSTPLGTKWNVEKDEVVVWRAPAR
jgi:poly-gamma-glutamate synthesis protein (capsule biosynthesis protein)